MSGWCVREDGQVRQRPARSRGAAVVGAGLSAPSPTRYAVRIGHRPGPPPTVGYRAGGPPATLIDMSDFDLVVIGSGPGGQKAAVAAAKLGRKVAVVERGDMVGGVCINTGT